MINSGFWNLSIFDVLLLITIWINFYNINKHLKEHKQWEQDKE